MPGILKLVIGDRSAVNFTLMRQRQMIPPTLTRISLILVYKMIVTTRPAKQR
ncbi:MAG: hypothetical protein O4861_22665 [Trichodesmium sp. St16_bin4-tuft]|nr:hypothetical protein [Trichodesmium sp. MAG_R01]MDE5067644.1 hypothetical protein [Trichodesmium sp. St4_bin8_1]MDE5072014.1 hypothetical protein [Trichodesmium sp. St5_bin8]MDE5077088.1 hypothetical protein [Trichodesmium sp. St2_bin6]MDE5090360.1 hypothetical protein [Trichodesmium sp. St18_bin3_1_1]MDE5100977.1 hypothetical protein [Trichodesmium sp. St16_bin4-tuft]MDE5102474.1 hypothetical protein [Trichodesmium sp. St19_bin2]